MLLNLFLLLIVSYFSMRLGFIKNLMYKFRIFIVWNLYILGTHFLFYYFLALQLFINSLEFLVSDYYLNFVYTNNFFIDLFDNASKLFYMVIDLNLSTTLLYIIIGYMGDYHTIILAFTHYSFKLFSLEYFVA
jgi:hypothetical protein